MRPAEQTSTRQNPVLHYKKTDFIQTAPGSANISGSIKKNQATLTKATPKPKARTAARKKPATGRKRQQQNQRRPAWQRALLIITEILALTGAALIAVIAVLGRAAERFGGSSLTDHLLPFSASVLLLALAGSALLGFWFWLRQWLKTKSLYLPAILSVTIVVAAGILAAGEPFSQSLGSLRTLLGGPEVAARTGISHQVYAAYRRTDLVQMQKLLERSESYLPAIRKAAKDNQVDPEVMVGIAAAESSFLPRDSKDGGKGLFQITAPPAPAVKTAAAQLNIGRPDPLNQTHNAYMAAATLKYYLAEMQNDLFLGLLAYNIGPKNGGLLSIMNQYGARDFYTIKPYLQQLPGDYPIRVLTAALAYRLWRTDGHLPRYEEGTNARHIQHIGIPGMKDETSSEAFWKLFNKNNSPT